MNNERQAREHARRIAEGTPFGVAHDAKVERTTHGWRVAAFIVLTDCTECGGSGDDCAACGGMGFAKPDPNEFAR